MTLSARIADAVLATIEREGRINKDDLIKAIEPLVAIGPLAGMPNMSSVEVMNRQMEANTISVSRPNARVREFVTAPDMTATEITALQLEWIEKYRAAQAREMEPVIAKILELGKPTSIRWTGTARLPSWSNIRSRS